MLPAGWLVPDWPAPQNVRAVCTSREGGKSVAPYDSFNLGDHVGDAAGDVSANRIAFAEAIEARPVFLRQVHGHQALKLIAETPDGIEADGCATDERGVACTIMVADCLPVLFATDDGKAVAAAHCGWRSLAGEGGQGILDAVVAELRREAGCEADAIVAWLGPAIGPTKFEVGGDVKAAFDLPDSEASGFFKPHTEGKWLADLPGLTRQALSRLGVTRIHGNDGSTGWCTVSNPSRFFSHRRDRVSGRLAAAVWLA